MSQNDLTITDSVVMGDVKHSVTNVHQNVADGLACNRCQSQNVRIMSCSTTDCSNQFCELCHPECRWSLHGVSRFDSGRGKGPYCGLCMDKHLRQWEHREEISRLRKLMQEARTSAIIGAVVFFITYIVLLIYNPVLGMLALPIMIIFEIGLIIQFAYSWWYFFDFDKETF